MPNTTGLPMGDAVQFGWSTLRGSTGFVIGTTLAAWGVPLLIEWGGDVVFDDGPQAFAIWLIELIVYSTFYLGLFKIYLRFRDGEVPILDNLFDGLARVHYYIGAAIIISIAVGMGLILLIVPGIIIMVRLAFVGFVLVDDRVGPLDAIQRSWDITRGYTLDLFLFFILLCGINVLGAMCLLVGLLVSLPVSGLAMAYVYRVLKPKGTAHAVNVTPQSVAPAV